MSNYQKKDGSARVEYGIGGTASLGFQAWFTEVATEALRVLKPGGHLLAFGGARTYHRLAVAIEDAGFEIRDSMIWLYGSGFPKSHDVSKAIDKGGGHWPVVMPRNLDTSRKPLESQGPESNLRRCWLIPTHRWQAFRFGQESGSMGAGIREAPIRDTMRGFAIL